MKIIIPYHKKNCFLNNILLRNIEVSRLIFLSIEPNISMLYPSNTWIFLEHLPILSYNKHIFHLRKEVSLCLILAYRLEMN